MRRTLTRALLAIAALLTPMMVMAGPAAGAPAGDSAIAVLDNNLYGDSDQETALVIADLIAGGHDVTTFDGITAADFSAALDGADVLVIPELEGDETLDTDLSGDAIDVVSGFVNGGGRIVFFGSNDPSPTINAIFGFSVVSAGGACDVDRDVRASAATTRAAAGVAAGGCDRVDTQTELVDGPTSLPYVDDTTGLSVASLPSGSTVPYVDAADADIAAVALMPFGDGMVVFLGYDWYPGLDGEDDEDDEFDVEDRSASTSSSFQRDGARLAAEGDDPGYDEWEAVLDAVVSQPVVTIVDVTVEEGEDAVFAISIDGPSSQPVTVALSTADGTAVGPDDFEPNATSVTIAPGATSATFTVPTETDTDDEDDETFTVAGVTAAWGLVSGPGAATISDVAVPATTSGGVQSTNQTPAATPTVVQPTFTG